MKRDSKVIRDYVAGFWMNSCFTQSDWHVESKDTLSVLVGNILLRCRLIAEVRHNSISIAPWFEINPLYCSIDGELESILVSPTCLSGLHGVIPLLIPSEVESQLRELSLHIDKGWSRIRKNDTIEVDICDRIWRSPFDNCVGITYICNHALVGTKLAAASLLIANGRHVQANVILKNLERNKYTSESHVEFMRECKSIIVSRGSSSILFEENVSSNIDMVLRKQISSLEKSREQWRRNSETYRRNFVDACTKLTSKYASQYGSVNE